MSSMPAPPPPPPQAGPQQMAGYYGSAPKPPEPLPAQPPPTPEQVAAHAQAMSQYEDAKADYEAVAGPPPQPAPVVVPAAPGGGSGKPAARMGDLTAHGGSIVQGLPTVLIANKPAATVTHMHLPDGDRRCAARRRPDHPAELDHGPDRQHASGAGWRQVHVHRPAGHNRAGRVHGSHRLTELTRANPQGYS